jgi:hypothetical protein
VRLNIHRKVLFGAAALVLPLATAGVLIGSGGTAFAKSGPNGPTVTCNISTTVTFPTPGLSKNGSENTSKTDATTTDNVSYSSCTNSSSTSGSQPGLSIVSKATKCKSAGNPDSVCTAKGEYAYDTESGFEAAGTASILKSLKKMSVTIGDTTFSIKNSGATAIAGSAPCASNEVGFEITGSIKSPKLPENYKGGSSTFVACLLHDTGPGTTGNFFSDLTSGTGTIQTVSLDSTRSTVTLTS